MTATTTLVLPVVRSQASGAGLPSMPDRLLDIGSVGTVEGTARSASSAARSGARAPRRMLSRPVVARVVGEKGHVIHLLAGVGLRYNESGSRGRAARAP